MRTDRQIGLGILGTRPYALRVRVSLLSLGLVAMSAIPDSTLAASHAADQVNVLTAHNDIARTGQNLGETILTAANVNAFQFGKIFSQPSAGKIYAQPLYVSNLSIPGRGTHNVVYIANSSGGVYAFDADSNGGSNASPLWKTSLLSAVPGSESTVYTILGTPVIDLATNNLYVVGEAEEGEVPVFRLHALDLATGVEKLGGPVRIQGSVSGTGSGSSGGVLTFNPVLQYQRPALLLVNGVVYIAFGSVNDNGAWHGWIFSYNDANLQQLNIFCPSPNGSAAGLWMGGAGLSAEVNGSTSAFGRMFVATGNGSYAASLPYTNAMSYGMSILNLDLTGGVMAVQDEFTPSNWQQLDNQDGDVGSGGAILLPTQTLASGRNFDPLIQVGKTGTLHVLDRNNLGGFNATADQVVQEVQTPQSGSQNWGAGIWGAPGYWNQNVYFGGTNPGASNSLTAYSFTQGVLSSAPTSQTTRQFSYPAPTPSVSANGIANGIVWVLDVSSYVQKGDTVLLAYDATNLANLLYATSTNLSRDDPGGALPFTVATIANGKVYVGTKSGLSVYGLLGNTVAAPAPVLNVPTETFTGALSVSITDAVSGATIYYTTDGSSPTVNSNTYAGPITLTSSETVTAIASATGYLLSAPASATYAAISAAANPKLSLASGSYSGTQTVVLTDGSSGAAIYYTVDGSTPTTASNLYTQPIAVPVSEAIQAMAVVPGLLPSSIVSADYVIATPYTIDFSQGFAQAEGPIQFNGSTDLDDFRLQLTNGGFNEAGSAFYATAVNIQSFTTDFTFQLSNPAADGFTFTIQNVGPTALGGDGGGLGYKGITNSVAVKFDLYNTAGEGPNSTGIYTDGTPPTQPSFGLSPSGVDLHSGDYMNAHITYDGTHLNLTLTDAVTLATFTKIFNIDIPSVIGGPTAWVGFTAGTGGLSSSQKLTYWTYLAGQPPIPDYPSGFDNANLIRHGSALSGTSLQLTNNPGNPTTSTWFATPVEIQSFSTDFRFQVTNPAVGGFAFVLQNQGAAARGTGGGGLGYATIPNSVAIKFDFYNNAGEGTDSTGVYLNGTMPTGPSIDLTASGVQLNSGDVIHAYITYDGTNLIWTLIDETAHSHPAATNIVLINIPQTIASNTAYVGFTAASGGTSTVQNVLTWAMASQ